MADRAVTIAFVDRSVNERISGLAQRLLGSSEARLPANVALMHLLLEAADPAEVGQAIAAAEETAGRLCIDQARRVQQIAALWHRYPEAWNAVRAAAPEHGVPHATAEDSLRYWACTYDRLARTAPDTSVALYALGSPELLAATSGEIVSFLAQGGLIAPDSRVLDIGCGSGRLIDLVAPRCGSVVGIDISGEMLRRARRRCARHANVSLMRSSGRDLAMFADANFDLVLAADVFPHMFEGGPLLVRRNLAEIARVLDKPGTLVIFNFSYGRDVEADRADLAGFAQESGIEIVGDGLQPFEFWDAVCFVLAKRPP